MASCVLQPLDEFRIELRRRLDAELRSELLHTGAIQDDERYRKLVYTRWWQYLKHRFNALYKLSDEVWSVPDLIGIIQRSAGMDPAFQEICLPGPEAADPDEESRCWSFRMRRRRWYIREYSFEGYQHLTISWDVNVPGLNLTSRTTDMVILLDDKADVFDSLIAERKLEAWRRFTIHNIRQITKSYGKQG